MIVGGRLRGESLRKSSPEETAVWRAGRRGTVGGICGRVRELLLWLRVASRARVRGGVAGRVWGLRRCCLCL